MLDATRNGTPRLSGTGEWLWLWHPVAERQASGSRACERNQQAVVGCHSVHILSVLFVVPRV